MNTCNHQIFSPLSSHYVNGLSVAAICSLMLSYEKFGWFMDSCLVHILSGLVPVAVSCSFLEPTFALVCTISPFCFISWPYLNDTTQFPQVMLTEIWQEVEMKKSDLSLDMRFFLKSSSLSNSFCVAFGVELG